MVGGTGDSAVKTGGGRRSLAKAPDNHPGKEYCMKICVFCSSGRNLPAIYYTNVRDLAVRLGREGHSLVFGGFAAGLMETVADGFEEAGSEIIGVIPESLISPVRHVHKGCTEVITTSDLAERKQKMIEAADGLLTVPGGTGTLDEFFSAVAMKQADELDKPIVLYDPNGFYADLMHWFERAGREQFMVKPMKDLFIYCQTADEVIRAFVGERT